MPLLKGFLLPDNSFIPADDHLTWLRANLASLIPLDSDPRDLAQIAPFLHRLRWVRVRQWHDCELSYHVPLCSGTLERAQAHFEQQGVLSAQACVSLADGRVVHFRVRRGEDWRAALRDAIRIVGFR